MKKTILFILSFAVVNFSFAQNKKKQIKLLNNRLDSLQIASQNEYSIRNNEIDKLARATKDLEIQKVNLQNNAVVLNATISDLKQNNLLLKDSLNNSLNDLIKLDSTYKSSLQKMFESNAKLDSNNKVLLQRMAALKSKLDSVNKLYDKLTKVSTIKIGTQEWMTEDIKTTVYNNGDPIYEAKQEEQWVECGNKKIGCYRKLSNGTLVYNGFAVNDERGILPAGFELPKYNQFAQLIKFLGGGESQTGKATKSLATYPIIIPGNDGEEEVNLKTNGSSGFKAKPGGFVYDHGSLDNMWDLDHGNNCSYWWTASYEVSSYEEGNIVVVDIGYCSQDLGDGKGLYPPTFGFAVRGIKK
jgi:uncharacterized protein (TIGR02145 family)